MSQAAWERDQRRALAEPKRRDVYEVVSLAAAIASIGFVLGPALIVGFGWAFASIAIVTATQSKTGATAGMVLGILAALASVGVMFANLW